MEIVVWLVLCVILGFWADSKGRNGFGWGGLSIVISPLLAAVILYFSLEKQNKALAEEQKRATAKAEALTLERQAKADELKNRTTIGAEEFCSELKKLWGLRENSLLTDEEYKTQKRNVIGYLSTRSPREPSMDFLSALIPLARANALNEDELLEIKKLVLSL